MQPLQIVHRRQRKLIDGILCRTFLELFDRGSNNRSASDANRCAAVYAENSSSDESGIYFLLRRAANAAKIRILIVEEDGSGTRSR